MLYPSLMVLVQTDQRCVSGGRAFTDMWLPILFVLFAAGDFLGRLGAQLSSHQTLLNERNIWMPAVLRMGLIPLFMSCKIRNGQLPVAFPDAGIPIFLVLLLGLSNGYLGNLAMMLGPEAVKKATKDDANKARGGTGENRSSSNSSSSSSSMTTKRNDSGHLAGIIMILCLSTGLLVGSLVSFLLVFIVTGSA